MPLNSSDSLDEEETRKSNANSLYFYRAFHPGISMLQNLSVKHRDNPVRQVSVISRYHELWTGKVKLADCHAGLFSLGLSII